LASRLGVLTAVLLLGLGGVSRASAQAVAASRTSYRSPYRIEFSQDPATLIGDLLRSERGDPRLESEVPFEHWYTRRTLERWHAWGPPARLYPPPAGVNEWSIERKRERVIAVALRYQGYSYQHHHIPDWDPPAGWPWKPTRGGSNGPGVDCSNFTGFIYNIGFGLHLSGNVYQQSHARVAKEAETGRSVDLRRIELPDSYSERMQTLQTGDLVFIRGQDEQISHVVIWVGALGRSSDGVPLIIDSHGEGVVDSEKQHIPDGVQIRPFREKSWYNRNADHALRVFHESKR
jgi:hypothetical protein